MKKVILLLLVITSFLASCASNNKNEPAKKEVETVKTEKKINAPQEDIAQMLIDRYAKNVTLTDAQKKSIVDMVNQSNFDSASKEEEKRAIFSSLRKKIRNEILTDDQKKSFKSKRGN